MILRFLLTFQLRWAKSDHLSLQNLSWLNWCPFQELIKSWLQKLGFLFQFRTDFAHLPKNQEPFLHSLWISQLSFLWFHRFQYLFDLEILLSINIHSDSGFQVQKVWFHHMRHHTAPQQGFSSHLQTYLVCFPDHPYLTSTMMYRASSWSCSFNQNSESTLPLLNLLFLIKTLNFDACSSFHTNFPLIVHKLLPQSQQCLSQKNLFQWWFQALKYVWAKFIRIRLALFQANCCEGLPKILVSIFPLNLQSL